MFGSVAVVRIRTLGPVGVVKYVGYHVDDAVFIVLKIIKYSGYMCVHYICSWLNCFHIKYCVEIYHTSNTAEDRATPHDSQNSLIPSTFR